MTHQDARPAEPVASQYPPVSPWIGWIAFAGIVMVVLGAFHILQGLVNLLDPDAMRVGGAEALLDLDPTASGWVQIIAGGVVVVAGLCVFGGQKWARAVGVLIVLFSLVANFGLLSTNPGWSIVLIAVDVVVLLALTVHGSDVRP